MYRYWVMPTNYVYREWTDEEYKTCDPKNGITETMAYVKCNKCGQIIGVYWDTTTMYCHHCHTHIFRPYQIVYLDTKLKCLEYSEKEIDGHRVSYTKLY
jgi:ribosomal protein S27E